MNRIIIIGNGFDKAHGLETGYRDFIDTYWHRIGGKVFNGYDRYLARVYGVVNRPNDYEDEFITFQVIDGKQSAIPVETPKQGKEGDPYYDICKFIINCNADKDSQYTLKLSFKNLFFKHISERCYLDSWLGIENEYYECLKKLIHTEDTLVRRTNVRKLNSDLNAIKDLLERYLEYIVETTPKEKHTSIQDAFQSPIALDEIAHGKSQMVFDSIISYINHIEDRDVVGEDMVDDHQYWFCRSINDEKRYYIEKHVGDDKFKKEYLTPIDTLVLNFNYTDIAELYRIDNMEYINIHGELYSDTNPMIFGYGDELDDHYKEIEKLQDNDFLEHIKSVRYLETDNYCKLLSFVESEPYQIFVMGHSCGNSDRTLLNTLFEHRNCFSIKVFYHQLDDDSDNYNDLVRNISRNFNDKQNMRDVVVNHSLSSPLVPRVK